MAHRRPKLRGGRRYYSEVRRRAEQFDIPRLGPWYDMWHTHIDWRGLGRARHPCDHMRALLTVLRRVEEQAATLGIPHQVWAVINTADAADDAVYLHTPNPNGDTFPYQFEGVAWSAPIPPLLADLVSPSDYDIGTSRYSGLMYWVRRPNAI